MNTIRVRSTEIIPRIAKRLTFHDPRLLPTFLEELASRMNNAPETILFLAALDEEEEIKAFIIAQNPGPNIPFVVLAQVWSDPDNDPTWYEPFQAKLVMWAWALDKDYVRAETRRNGEALYRRFGFQPTANIVTLDIKSKVKEELQWAARSDQT